MRGHIATSRRWFVKLIVLGIALAPIEAHGGVIVWDQPHDFVGFSPSEQNTAINNARTADDFEVFLFDYVIVDMIVSFPNMPTTYGMDFFSDNFGRPGDFIASGLFPAVEDLGEWNGNPNLRHVRVSFSRGGGIGDPGRYWVSPYGIGTGLSDQRAFWGTAGNGSINLAEGHFRSEELGFPDWTSVSDPGLLGFETDFAMQVGFIPAPGTLIIILSAGAYLTRPRRRRPCPRRSRGIG